MESNYQMLRTFEYHPEARGMCNSKEFKMIEDHFKITSRSDVELQNLRDFVVMFYSMKLDGKRNEDTETYLRLCDEMSAITGVIDSNKFDRGLEV